MKKYFFILVALCAFIGCKDNSGLYGLLTDYDARIAKLESLCSQMNTNITSLTTIVEAQQSGEAITSITPIMEDGDVIGYTITFANYDPITIYTGRGDSGPVPAIGVKQDTDGVYYWTLDGEWMLDGNGKRVTATPQLKIEADYWWISYDNGATWTKLSSAKGDSIFQSVTQDENYVYFTLEDGTVITVSKGGGGDSHIIDGAIQAIFSVSASTKVHFSQGNLQYRASTQTWRFAEKQYDMIGDDNANISVSYSGWIDLFGWGSGNNPTLFSTDYSDYQIFIDWGVNAISNGGNKTNQWRTLTKDEWDYLVQTRYNAEKLCGQATVVGVHGLVFLPDNWTTPNSLTWQGMQNNWITNQYSATDWSKMEAAGAVFLPAAGYRVGTKAHASFDYYYWSSSPINDYEVGAYDFAFSEYSAGSSSNDRFFGLSVRLVKDVK
ncbi:MAG: hypothetical protein II928_02170 [Paludibacteraceae bacterium]|nr:hypothetical protein [Paludibacteraceae bacterium]